MASGDRVYLPQVYPDNPNRRPVVHDLGNVLNVSGLVLQGMGATAVLLLPTANPVVAPSFAILTLAEWGELIAQTDDPEEFIGEEGGVRKVLQRKSRNVISGAMQWKIWARDGYRCMYCQRMGGVAGVSLSIDHWIPLELGGVNDETNYLAACRNCNKAKGNMTPEAWVAKRKLDFDYAGYLVKVNA